MDKRKHNIKESILQSIDSFFKVKGDFAEEFFKYIRNGNERIFLNHLREVENGTHILDKKEFDLYFPLISNVIITANKIECDALNYIFEWQGKSTIFWRKDPLPIFEKGDNLAVDAFLIKYSSSYILHLNAADTGSNTPGGSADLVRYISSCEMLNPSIIISFGICYGIDPDNGGQEIGDVIIPAKLYPWSIGQKTNEKNGKVEFKIKSDNYNLNLSERFKAHNIYSLLKNFCNSNLRTITISNFNEKCLGLNIRVFYGSMHTGEAVVSSIKLKEVIARANESKGDEKLLGGEMEGYGLAKECVYHADTPCFIIKAICDWGAEKNSFDNVQYVVSSDPNKKFMKDKVQTYAAFCAGLALLKLYQEYDSHFLLSKMENDIKLFFKKTVTSTSDDNDLINHIHSQYKISKRHARFIIDKLYENNILLYDKDTDKYYLNSGD